jgi:hypothetical protein
MKENEINDKYNELVWEAPRLIFGLITETQSGTIGVPAGEGVHTYSSNHGHSNS